jgi:hypothetical protein
MVDLISYRLCSLRWARRVRNAPVPELISEVNSPRVCRTQLLDRLGESCRVRYIINTLRYISQTTLDNTFEGQGNLLGISWGNRTRAVDKLV